MVRTWMEKGFIMTWNMRQCSNLQPWEVSHLVAILPWPILKKKMKGATEDPKERKASDNTWNKNGREQNVEQIVNAKGMFPGKCKLRDFTKGGKKQ